MLYASLSRHLQPADCCFSKIETSAVAMGAREAFVAYRQRRPPFLFILSFAHTSLLSFTRNLLGTWRLSTPEGAPIYGGGTLEQTTDEREEDRHFQRRRRMSSAAASGSAHNYDGIDMGEGSLGFPKRITSSTAEARAWFARGWMHISNFNHLAAVDCFNSCIEVEPDCAMAWWGIGESVHQG